MTGLARQARISREQVLDATVQIAEARGVQAISMRFVAARLGVTPRTLHRHVRDKEDLLDGVVERLLAEAIPDPDLPWDQRLRAMTRRFREIAARHPDTFLMLLRCPATTPGVRRVCEAICAGLSDAGVPNELIPRLERLLSAFMLGFAASEAGGRFATHDRATLDADLEWAQSQVARAVQAPQPQHRPRG